ncbi:hypothetical protein [Sulfitobacter sp. 915]|uniref:GumK N-terminal domain-containing glycosyltransferase n=1 Tax=Sulfitobacter sp. 915 TaxID=3368558 RepID=UPI0037468177
MQGICESGPPVLLGPLLAEQAPQAARIYCVSDDIRFLNATDALLGQNGTTAHRDLF